MRRTAVAGTVLALLAATAGCSGSGDEYEQVCVDEATGQRVADSRCPTDWYSTSYLYPGTYWYFFPSYYAVPAVGRTVDRSTSYRYDRLPKTVKVSSVRPASSGGAVNPGSTPKRNTWQQPPKSNGGTYKPPASAPKPPSTTKYR